MPAHLRLGKLEEIWVLRPAHHGPASSLDKPFAFVSLALHICGTQSRGTQACCDFVLTEAFTGLFGRDGCLRQGAVCRLDGLDS